MSARKDKQFSMWMLTQFTGYEGGPVQKVTLKITNGKPTVVLADGRSVRHDGNLFSTFSAAKAAHVQLCKEQLNDLIARLGTAKQALKNARALKIGDE